MSRQVKLENLIAEKIITAPFKIFAKFKGQHFIAEIDKDGFIIFEEKRYTSLSIAAGIVRAKLSGQPKDGFPYRRANGWTFWHYNDLDGNRKKIDELRSYYRQVNKILNAMTVDSEIYGLTSIRPMKNNSEKR